MKNKKRYFYDRKKQLTKYDLIKKIKVKYINNAFNIAIKTYNNEKGLVFSYTDNEIRLRIILNHIRHKLTNYDTIINRNENYDNSGFKEMVNRKIIDKYRKDFMEFI